MINATTIAMAMSVLTNTSTVEPRSHSNVTTTTQEQSSLRYTSALALLLLSNVTTEIQHQSMMRHTGTMQPFSYRNATTTTKKPKRPKPRFRHPDLEKAHYIWVIWSPITIVMGTIGNVLAIVVLSRKEMRKATSSMYLIILAVSDIFVLYLGLLRNFIRELYDVDVRDHSEPVCKLHIFLVYFTGHFSAWVLVAVAVERFISVWFPFKAKVLCTRRNGLFALLLLVAILLAADGHFFWTHGVRFIKYKKRIYRYGCTINNPDYEHFDEFIWPWIDAFFFSYGPFALMLTCNIMIIVRLLRPRLQKSHGRNAISDKNASKMNTMTAMLLTVSFTFLLLTAPISLYISGQYTWWKTEMTSSLENNARFQVYWAVASMLAYMNNAANFLLYIVSGPKFRRELSLLFGCRRCQGQVKPEGSSSPPDTASNTIELEEQNIPNTNDSKARLYSC